MSAASGFVQIQRRNLFACSGHVRSSDGTELSLAQSIGHYMIGCRIYAESMASYSSGRFAGWVAVNSALPFAFNSERFNRPNDRLFIDLQAVEVSVRSVRCTELDRESAN